MAEECAQGRSGAILAADVAGQLTTGESPPRRGAGFRLKAQHRDTLKPVGPSPLASLPLHEAQLHVRPLAPSCAKIALRLAWLLASATHYGAMETFSTPSR